MGEGWKNIIWGAIIIGIGFTYGGSIFMGDPDGFDYVFDLVGLVLISMGVYQLISGRSKAD